MRGFVRRFCKEKRGEWGRGVKGGRYFVAMPEHLARMFKATRSPRRIFRTGPRTEAHWVMGSKDSPSLMCHFTLRC